MRPPSGLALKPSTSPGRHRADGLASPVPRSRHVTAQGVCGTLNQGCSLARHVRYCVRGFHEGRLGHRALKAPALTWGACSLPPRCRSSPTVTTVGRRERASADTFLWGAVPRRTLLPLAPPSLPFLGACNAPAGGANSVSASPRRREGGPRGVNSRRKSSSGERDTRRVRAGPAPLRTLESKSLRPRDRWLGSTLIPRSHRRLAL